MRNHSRRQPASIQKPALQIGIAILAGQMFVNLPAITMIFLITFFGLHLTRDLVGSLGLVGSILIGAFTGWLWWSFSISRWRNWAHKNGAPEEQLQKWAVITGLVWPKDPVFERTEY